jgi:uncharacterized protein (TIGR02270 family)
MGIIGRVAGESTMSEGIADIITQHAEEAAFLWRIREAIVHAPHYSLQELAGHDERIEAHLDGLRIAGEAGWEACRKELAWEEAGEVFVAAVLALEGGSGERYDAMVEAAGDTDEQARGFVSALGWLPWSRAQRYVERLLGAESATMQYLGIAGSAIHRQDPGAQLLRALAAPGVRLRALKAVGELGRRDLLRSLYPHLQTEDATCRFWAAWSAVRLGDDYALDTLLSIAEAGGRYEEKALDLALRRVPLARAQDIVRGLLAQPGRERLAVVGAGVVGDPAVVPWLIGQMAEPALARVAGEAFTNITGMDLAYEDLEGEWPEGFEAGPTEDPEDENVEMDRDEDLPWPDPALVAAWWHANAGRFRPGTRYFLGRPLGEPVLQEALRRGKQRQRAAAALELALLHPSEPLFEVRAPGFRQQQMLGLAPSR